MQAAELSPYLALPASVRALLNEQMTAHDFLCALTTRKLYAPSIDVVAMSLDIRESVWWGCVCLQHVSAGNYAPLDRAACKAAVQWIIDPTEENRVAARPPAEAAGPSSPAGRLAAAVYQTGVDTSFAKPVATAPFAAAKAVANAVKLACTLCPPVAMVETQRIFVEFGMTRVQ